MGYEMWMVDGRHFGWWVGVVILRFSVGVLVSLLLVVVLVVS